MFIGDSETSYITLEKVNINGGVNIYNTTGLTILNCTFDASTKGYYAIWADDGTKNITAESGNFIGGKTAVLARGSDLDKNSIIVNDGSFTAKEGTNIVLEGNDFNLPIINNGSFNKEPNQYLIEDTTAIVESSGSFTIGQTAIDTI